MTSPRALEPILEHLVISPTFEVLLATCIPRLNKAVLNTLYLRVRTPWTIELSLFKEYLREDKEELLEECFEFDWKNMKQLKYKGCKEEEVKEVMRSGYKMIKEYYKVESGYGMIGGTFSIALNQYTDFVKETAKIIDGVNVN